MKNKLLPLFFVVTFFLLSAPSASAVTNGVVKVGLRYGSSALASANLENAEGVMSSAIMTGTGGSWPWDRRM